MGNILQDLLSIDDFEQFIADLWEEEGWNTRSTQGSRDGGIDVVATKSGRKHLIQVKQWQLSEKIGAPAVRQYAGLLEQENDIDCVEIVSTTEFTQPAQSISRDMDVKLVPGEELAQIVRETGPKLIDDFTQEGSMSKEGNDVPSSAYDLRDATRITKKYAELFVDGEWEAVVNAEDDNDTWWIMFRIESGSQTKQKRIHIEKESAEIRSIVHE